MPIQSKFENSNVIQQTEITKSITGNDPYRDSFIRLFGYSQIIGQTTESIVCRPNFSKLCTGITILYTVCDVYDKFLKTSNIEQNNIPDITPTQNCKHKKTIMIYYVPYIAASNAVIWHSVASYLVPAFAVNQITHLTQRMVNKLSASGKLKSYLPPIIGIASIPLIMTPIDNGVTKLMEIAKSRKMNLISDTYRETIIRILGYAFVISRTTYRGLHNKRQMVDLCYSISVLYSFADAIDKCNTKALLIYSKSNLIKNNNSEIIPQLDQKYETIITAIDVCIWQALSSFILPGYILNAITIGTGNLVRIAQIKEKTRCTLPSIAALSVLPFIIIPIDRIVDAVLEHTYRKLF